MNISRDCGRGIAEKLRKSQENRGLRRGATAFAPFARHGNRGCRNQQPDSSFSQNRQKGVGPIDSVPALLNRRQNVVRQQLLRLLVHAPRGVVRTGNHHR